MTVMPIVLFLGVCGYSSQVMVVICQLHIITFIFQVMAVMPIMFWMYIGIQPRYLHFTMLSVGVSKAHIPPAVAIRGCNTFRGNLFGEKEKKKKEKRANKRTDKPYVANSFIHSTTCYTLCLYQISKS